MAAASSLLLLAIMVLASSPLVLEVTAADEDPLQDFCVADNTSMITLNGFTCKPDNEVQAWDFKSMLLEHAAPPNNALGASVNLATAANFPGLNTQGLSIARIDFEPKGLNPPHVHPRATEVLFLVTGTLKVGFVSGAPNNTLFQQILYPGDLFVFPRGLVHFQLNVDMNQPALSISALNSQNPGLSQLAVALFAAYPPLPEEVLEKTFDIDQDEVNRLIASVAKTLS